MIENMKLAELFGVSSIKIVLVIINNLCLIIFMIYFSDENGM